MNDKNKFQTDFLTANSFLIGWGSIYNLAGNYFEYNDSESPEEADAMAIMNDWYVIGQDIGNSLSKFEKEVEKQLVIPF